MSERIGITGRIEKAAKRVAPYLAVAGLALAGCSDDKEPVDSQLQTLHTEATELCTDEARDLTAAQFPEVTVPNNAPSVEELKAALEAAEARESQAPEFLQNKFDSCFQREFTDVVNELGVPTLPVDGSVPNVETTIVTATSEA